MKKIRLAIIIFLSLLITACGWNREDENRALNQVQNSGNHMSAQHLYDKKWLLQKIASTKKTELPQKAYIVFSESGKVSGFSGCNRFQGRYSVENEQLKIGPLGSTRKACPQIMGFEARVLKVFRNTNRYQIHNGKLELYLDGQPLAVFK